MPDGAPASRSPRTVHLTPAAAVADAVHWTRPRPAASVGILLQVGRELDVDPDLLLADTQVTPALLADPAASIGGMAEIMVVRNLQAARPDVQHLGLLAGARTFTTMYGPLGAAFASADTLLEALRLVVRFRTLTWAMTTSVTEVAGGDLLSTFQADDLPDDVHTFYLQRELAAILTGAREILRTDTVPCRAGLPQLPDADARLAITSHLGFEPEFGATSMWCALPLSVVTAPAPHRSPHTHAVMVAECDRQARAWADRSRLSAQVRELLAARLAEGPSLTSVAKELSISERTLRRGLADEGHGFRDLLDQVRAGTATRLLNRGELNVAQVAEQLGYESASAFSAAFRRWHGTTPRSRLTRASAEARCRAQGA